MSQLDAILRTAETNGRQLARDLSAEWARRDPNKPTRAWGEFFGPLSIPRKDALSIRYRVERNSQLYQTNYLFLFAFAAIAYVSVRPTSAILLACVVRAWVLVFSKQPIIIFGRLVPKQLSMRIVAITTLFLLATSAAIASALRFIITSVTCLLLHALLRHVGLDRDEIRRDRRQASDDQ